MDDEDYEELWNERANFFDVDYRNYDDDFEFFEKYVSPDTDLLELGSGTGRLPLYLAENANRADGIDLSAEMVARARSKASDVENVSFYEADMAEFDLDVEYDLILNQGNSFLMMDDGQKRSTLRRVAEHLKPDGTFVVQIANPERWRQNPQRTMLHLRTVTNDDEAVTLTYTQNIDEEEQVNQMIWFRESVDAETGEVTKHVWPIDFQFLSHNDAVRMIKDLGFDITEVYGDFDREPFEEGSNRIIYECQPSE